MERARERDPWRVEGRRGDVQSDIQSPLGTGLAGERKPGPERLAGSWGPACARAGWKPAQPSGFTAVWLYKLVQGDASFLPFPTWALACSPSLGDEFSNKPEPRGGSTLPSQPWLAASSKRFSWPWGQYFSGCFSCTCLKARLASVVRHVPLQVCLVGGEGGRCW